MLDFFQSLADFLKSDLAKNNIWVVIVLIIICMCLSGSIVWFVMDKIILPSRLIELNNKVTRLEIRLEESQKKLDESENENKKMKNKIEKLNIQVLSYEFLKSINEKDRNFDDKAVKKFLKKNKKNRKTTKEEL